SGTQLRGIVRRAVRLADAMVRTDGRGVVLVTGDDDALTSVPGDVARWIVVRLLLDGLAEGHALAVSLESGPGTEAGPQVEAGSERHIRTAQSAPLSSPASGLVDSAASAGVRVEAVSGVWCAGFPAPGA